ncbi:hypothetical protein VTK26DRAFT_944 [Humicola hyalothermophila]
MQTRASSVSGAGSEAKLVGAGPVRHEAIGLSEGENPARQRHSRTWNGIRAKGRSRSQNRIENHAARQGALSPRSLPRPGGDVTPGLTNRCRMSSEVRTRGPRNETNVEEDSEELKYRPKRKKRACRCRIQEGRRQKSVRFDDGGARATVPVPQGAPCLRKPGS